MAVTAAGLDAESLRRLKEVNRLLDEAGGPMLRRAIMKDLRAPATAVARDLRAAARGVTGSAPKEWKSSAAAGVRVTVRLRSNPNIAVFLRRTSTSRQGWLLNQGKWRHPLFGDRGYWFEQRVRPGWFDETARAARPAFIRDASAALDKAATDLAQRINRI